MTGVISEVITPKDKVKSKPFAREKVRILSKSVVGFKSLPVSLRGGSFQGAASFKARNLNEWA